MSRTYRSNPRRPATYDYGLGNEYYWISADGNIYSSYQPYNNRLSKGGWKEAQRLLPRDQYAYMRICRGDKFTKYMRNASVPHWYRHEIEKQHRHHSNREIHRFMRNREYEPMVREKLDGVQWYYWY